MPISSKSRLLFMGTPEFACPSLQVLADSDSYNIASVITQPDKPTGRGNKVTPPPVKVLAESLELHVEQPLTLKDYRPEGEYDAFIAVAYGKIIPKSLIEYPRLGIINIHPSLLPRWRGAAPIQHALFAGDTVTGTCIMKIDEGLDTGPIYVCEELPIKPTDTFGTLHDKLAHQGATLLARTLPKILEGSIVPTPQDTNRKTTYAEKWDKNDLQINWNEPAEVTLRRIKTCYPRQGARAYLGDTIIKVFQAGVVHDAHLPVAEPGTVVEVNQTELIVATGSGFLKIEELQSPGKKRLRTRDFLRGHSITKGEKFL